MSFFCIHTYPKMPLVVVSIQKRKPRAETKDGMVLRYSSPVDPGNETGAQLMIDTLEAAFPSKVKAPGVFQVRWEEFQEVWDALQEELAPGPKYSTWERWAALLLAFALAMLQVALTCITVIPWIAVCAFRKQSGLLTAAETEVLFSIFDFRNTIKRLAKVWRTK